MNISNIKKKPTQQEVRRGFYHVPTLQSVLPLYRNTLLIRHSTGLYYTRNYNTQVSLCARDKFKSNK